METSGANIEALAETTVFLKFFKDLPDRRQPGEVVYPLAEILLLCLLAVLAGAEACTDIGFFPPVDPVEFQMDPRANFSVCGCGSFGYTLGMVAKGSGLRSRVERPLRKAFPAVRRKQDKHAAQAGGELMRGSVARHALRKDAARTAEHPIGNTLS